MKSLNKFEELVQVFEALPSIGKKSATKLAYHACVKDPLLGARLAHVLEEALRFISTCTYCGGLAQGEICEFCEDDSRDKELLCLVEDAKDILIIEAAAEYKGLYFVYDDNKDKSLERLKKMIEHFHSKEIIFAFTHNINKEALIFYIEEKLKERALSFSKIAQGIPSGVALENVDMMSLFKALVHRIKL